MQGLVIPLQRPLEIKVPPVIRYMERKYVETFFRTGELRLTTYAQCQIHECDVRRDSNEGKANFSFDLSNLGMGGWGLQTVGWQSYILCASVCESENLLQRFKVDSYFRINDVIGFFNAVSRKLADFDSGKIGACIYKDKDAFEKGLKFKGIPPNPNMATNSNGLALEPVAFEMSDEPYFIKSDLFAVEGEFRLIWSVSSDVKEPITLHCPEAIQFCNPNIPVSDSYKKPQNSGDIRGSVLMGSSYDKINASN